MNAPVKIEATASLPLQIGIYFNAYFAPCWLITHIYTLTQKYELLSPTGQAIAVTLHLLMVAVEFARLYFGFVGNLTENVPQLSGFWVATFLLQLPICLFSTCSSSMVGLPLDIGVDTVQIAFLVFELVIGIRTITLMARAQYSRLRQDMADDKDRYDKGKKD